MKINTMPKKFAAELLLFLAENEDFSSVSKLLGDEIAQGEIRAMLREISSGLIEESIKESKDNKFNSKENVYLSKQAKAILSYLSPLEENSLLSAFGIRDKS